MKPYKHDEPLDAEQLAAIEASEPAISVLAGPGSGKTRTLAHRARHLLLGDNESLALLLTFTNKAAAEMKSRALAVGDLQQSRIQATTFHGFGTKFLKSHGNLVGIDADFEILDQEERDEFAAEVARTLGINNRVHSWSNSRLRQREMRESLRSFGEAYEDAKRADGLVDFEDLVVYPAQILTDRPDMAQIYGSQYRHILIDEFQDTNAAQFATVQALAVHSETVSVFADDDQAIMQFAGAEAANVHMFSQELQAKVYPLTKNYRCRDEIVTRANLLIAADPDASGRQMKADKEGGTVELRTFASTSEEAEIVADEISTLVENQVMGPAEIAVLVRQSGRAYELVEALTRKGVPVTDWRGATHQSDGRRQLCICCSVLNSTLRTRQASRLSEFLDVELIEERDSHKFLTAHSANPVAAELLSLREEAFAGASPQAVVRRAHAAICIHDEEAGQRVLPLIEAVEDFEQFDPDFSIEQLMVELSLKSGGRSPTQGGGVKIASLHGTKGLQWQRVYLVGLEEGKLPDFRADEEGTIPNERRACFVGVCRAEDDLILTYSRTFKGFEQEPSRFLEEMELI
jgi:DNA helicase-2/ATP-dependent DNA helicase PcrA